MPTNALTIPPTTPKAAPRQVEQPTPPPRTAKVGGERAPKAGSDEPRFDEALHKAGARQNSRQSAKADDAAPELAQERPEAAQIEPGTADEPPAEAAADSTTSQPVESQTEPSSDRPEAAPKNETTRTSEQPPAASASDSDSDGAAPSARVNESAASAVRLATAIVAPPSEATLSASRPAKVESPRPATNAQVQSTAPATEPTPESGAAPATEPAPSPVATARAALVAQTESGEGTPVKEANAGVVSPEAAATEREASAAVDREPAPRRRATAEGAESIRPEAAPVFETRREGTESAILRALASQPQTAAAGSSPTGQQGGQAKDERGKAAGQAVEAALKAAGAAPSGAAAGAERAAPQFSVPGVSAPVAEAQSAPSLAQVRPESAPLTTPTSAQEAFESQVSRGLTAAVSQKGGVVTMRLQPEALGAVRIQMTIEHGAVQARFEAATPEARDLLNKHMETLRASLEAKGLSVDRLQVQLASPGHGGPGGQTGQHGANAGQDAQRSWSHDATDGRSRGAFDHRPDGEDRRGGGGDNRWSRAGAERWDDDGPDTGLRASVVRVGLDAVA